VPLQLPDQSVIVAKVDVEIVPDYRVSGPAQLASIHSPTSAMRVVTMIMPIFIRCGDTRGRGSGRMITRDKDGLVRISEEAFQHLPDEMRAEVEALTEQGHAVLAKVGGHLDKASRISRSRLHVLMLRHIQERLWNRKYTPDMESILDLDMLTTAFVVTYVRLHLGGGASGFERNELPEHLRAKHDEILTMRNERFAHDDPKCSLITDMTEIQYVDGVYELHSSLSLRYQFGGSPEWKELIEAIEVMLAARSEKLIEKMTVASGVEWRVAPPPNEVGETAS
jgi:hypothetical protein